MKKNEKIGKACFLKILCFFFNEVDWEDISINKILT